MTKKNKKNKKMEFNAEEERKMDNLAEALSIMILKTIIYIMSYVIYGGAFNVRLIQILLTIALVQGFFVKEKTREDVKKFISIIWGIVILILIIIKPKYTYRNAKDLVLKEGFTEVEALKPKVMLSNEFEEEGSNQAVYYYSAKKGSKDYYVQIHPKTGNIYKLEKNIGSYADEVYGEEKP